MRVNSSLKKEPLGLDLLAEVAVFLKVWSMYFCSSILIKYLNREMPSGGACVTHTERDDKVSM